MNSASRHLARHPHARASKLAELTLRDRKTSQLNAEIEAARKPKARLAENIRAIRQFVEGLLK